MPTVVIDREEHTLRFLPAAREVPGQSPVATEDCAGA